MTAYNSEDAVLISERPIYEDIFTSFHICKYEIKTNVTPERIESLGINRCIVDPKEDESFPEERLLGAGMYGQ
jgi:DNA-directed RNA polymerase beta subunit